MAKARTTTQQREQFERLVAEAEALVANNPRRYRFRLAALALLGYVVLFGVLTLLIGLIAGSIWGAIVSSGFLLLLLKKKLIIVLGVLVYAMVRALWVRVDAPEGFELDRRRFAILHNDLSKLRRTLKTPKIHRVILTEEFNAGISQTPRLGVLGWMRNTLILGLPLLLALSPEQARAVLAHEFGHLSGNHGRFNGWIYRVRVSWYRVMEAFDHAGAWGTGLLRRFFDWYAPYFSAYSFALARANEYEADMIAVEMTSAKTAGLALINTNAQSEISADRYWKPLLARADREAQPVRDPYEGLARFHKEHTLGREEMLERVRGALRQATEHADTHPSIRDRLSAINAPPVVPELVDLNAAQHWFGAHYEEVLRHFDAGWLMRNSQAWQERFEHAAQARTKLDELRARPYDTLSADERWQLASWTEEYLSAPAALPLFLAYQREYPDDLDASFVVGRLLLAGDDAAGIAQLERALAKFQLARDSCYLLYTYFRRHGDEVLAKQWLERAEQQVDREDQARAEREELSARDHFIACQHIDAEALRRLVDQLAQAGKIKHAWICEKQLHYLPDYPVYVVAFQARGWFADEDKLIATQLDIEWPGLTYLVMRKGRAGAVAKKVIEVGQQLK